MPLITPSRSLPPPRVSRKNPNNTGTAPPPQVSSSPVVGQKVTKMGLSGLGPSARPVGHALRGVGWSACSGAAGHRRPPAPGVGHFQPPQGMLLSLLGAIQLEVDTGPFKPPHGADALLVQARLHPRRPRLGSAGGGGGRMATSSATLGEGENCVLYPQSNTWADILGTDRFWSLFHSWTYQLPKPDKGLRTPNIL